MAEQILIEFFRAAMWYVLGAGNALLKPMSSQRFTVRAVLIILLIWCVSASILGALGALATLHPPFPQVILFGLVALLLTAYRF